MPTPVDKNVYALSISLALDTGQADATLNSFSNKLFNIERNISKIANDSFANITQLSSGLDRSFEEINTKLTKTNQQFVDIGASIDKMSKPILEQHDNQEEDLKNLLKKNKFLKDYFSQFEEILDISIKESDTMEGMVKIFDEIIDTIRKKNEGHKAEGGMLQQEVRTVNDLRHAFHHVSHLLGDGAVKLAVMYAELRAIGALVRTLEGDVEKFVTSNYRAYGTQYELIKQVAQSTGEAGLFYENTVAAYEALGKVRIPVDELGAYATVLSKANYYLGVDIKMLAEFSARARGAGYDLVGVERQLRFASEAMRKFGLDSHDVSKVLGATALDVAELQIAFGDVNAFENFNKIKLSLMGVNKILGQSTDVASKFADAMAADPILRGQWESMTGQAINSTEDFAKALLSAHQGLMTQGYDLDSLMQRAQANNKDAQITLQTLASLYTKGDVGALRMLDSLGKMTKGMALTGTATERLEQAIQRMSTNALNPFADASGSATAQLRILWSGIKSIVMLIGQIVMPIIYTALVIINSFIYGLFQAINFVSELWQSLQQIPVLGPAFQAFGTVLNWVFTIIKWGAGAVLTYLIVVKGLAAAFGIAATASTLLGTAITTSMAFAKTALIGTFQIIKVAGLSIKFLLANIGAGFAALGKAVQPVIMPLMALSVAIFITAAAAWVFAKAIEVIAQQGLAAIPVMFGMVAAITLMGAALVGLALIAGPLSPVILLLAAAIAIVAASTYLVGIGLEAMGKGLASIAESLSFGLIFKLPLLGVALAALGAAAVVAFPGMMLLSVAMMAVALSANVVVSALQMIAAIMPTISADTLVTIAEQFFKAGTLIFAAGSMLITGAGLLALGSGILYISSFTLTAAAFAITPAALSLLVGAGALIFGAGGLLVGATALFGAGTVLFGAATLVSGGAALVAIAGTLLFVGGNLMLAGLTAVLAATALLWPIGISLLFGAGLLVLGAGGLVLFGTVLSHAGSLINVGGQWLYAGALSLTRGLELLLPSTGQLFFAASMLLMAAGSLAMAGVLLIPASFGIYLGLLWLEMAISRFSKSIDKIVLVSKAVTSLAQSFVLMRNVPFNVFSDVADTALAAVPKIDALSAGLMNSAGKFNNAVNQFVPPSERLVQIFERLAFAVNEFQAGVKLGDDVANMAQMLDEYAGLLELTAERIETAVIAKAVPAMRAAEEAGLQEAVRSEAITTVQVLNKNVGGSEDVADDAHAAEMVRLLGSISTSLESIIADKSKVAIIADLLQEMLPELASKPYGLSNEMNDWSGR